MVRLCQKVTSTSTSEDADLNIYNIDITYTIGDNSFTDKVRNLNIIIIQRTTTQHKQLVDHWLAQMLWKLQVWLMKMKILLFMEMLALPK